MSADKQGSTTDKQGPTTEKQGATSTAAPSYLDLVRLFNKHVLNPVMMWLAGRQYWYAGVIRHTGRRSGKTYATPIVAEPVTGGFVVPLPYGTGVDWLRNVLAAGGATVQTGGRTYQVTDPEVVPAATIYSLVRPQRAWVWRLLRIEHFLKLSTSTS